MTIKSKLIIVGLIPLFLASVTAVSVYWTNEETTKSRVKLRTIQEITENVFELNLAVDQYLLQPEERPKVQFQTVFDSLKNTLALVSPDTEKERSLVNSMKESHQSMGKLFSMLVSLQGQGRSGKRENDLPELRERIISQVLADSREIVAQGKDLSRISAARLNAVLEQGLTFILLTILVSALGLVVFAFWIGRSILKPLHILRKGADTISTGDLNFRIATVGRDEIGQLSMAFNEMAQKLTGSYVTLQTLQEEIVERQKAEESLRQRTTELQHLTETLEERVRERTKELANLSAELVTAQEKERKRVSYDLHDKVWQILVAIRFDIERLFSEQNKGDWAVLENKSKTVMADLLEAVGKIRSMQGDLWPYVLDDIGILATIDWYCREFEKTHPVLTIEKRIDLNENEIPDSTKIIIYRVLQETLSNIDQHSQADRITLSLNKTDHRMILAVEDNGIGFDPEIVERSPWRGLGLLSIKARTELSGGTLAVESAKGLGTIIRASWPA